MHRRCSGRLATAALGAVDSPCINDKQDRSSLRDGFFKTLSGTVEMMHSPAGGVLSLHSGDSGTLTIGTGSPVQSHLSQVGLSHSKSGKSSRKTRWGDSRCEPQAGQASGTPRKYRMTADVHRLIAFSVVAMAASASCHLEPLA